MKQESLEQKTEEAISFSKLSLADHAKYAGHVFGESIAVGIAYPVCASPMLLFAAAGICNLTKPEIPEQAIVGTIALGIGSFFAYGMVAFVEYHLGCLSDIKEKTKSWFKGKSYNSK